MPGPSAPLGLLHHLGVTRMGDADTPSLGTSLSPSQSCWEMLLHEVGIFLGHQRIIHPSPLDEELRNRIHTLLV
jgi:hypothetical protein